MLFQQQKKKTYEEKQSIRPLDIDRLLQMEYRTGH